MGDNSPLNRRHSFAGPAHIFISRLLDMYMCQSSPDHILSAMSLLPSACWAYDTIPSSGSLRNRGPCQVQMHQPTVCSQQQQCGLTVQLCSLQLNMLPKCALSKCALG